MGAAATDKLVEPLMLPTVAEIVVVPTATPVATPAVLTVATEVVEDCQVAEEVRLFVLPSL